MKAIWPVSLSCEVLGVSVSGYFEHERRRRQRRPSQPGSGRLSDEALLAHIRATSSTIFHPSGTCRMGVDALAVVDPQLRVNGIAGLRVVDCSVMPTLVSGNTNAPAVMLAEKAVDMIRADARSRTQALTAP